jgi:hypothetical protein
VPRIEISRDECSKPILEFIKDDSPEAFIGDETMIAMLIHVEGIRITDSRSGTTLAEFYKVNTTEQQQQEDQEPLKCCSAAK